MNTKKKSLLLASALISLNLSAQVGIGTAAPHEAAMLDVVSTDKGILIPRVSLPSNDYDLNTNADEQPPSLLVYNTGGGALAEGFYYWDGAEWKSVDSSSSAAPEISELICERASLEPSSFKKGEAYSGLLRVPYLGGNGGKYSAGNPISCTGASTNKNLQIRLKAGRLAYGAGELVFDVTGIPTADSPAAATFPITFAGKSCQVAVGDAQNAVVASIATVGPLEKTSEGRNGYHRVITSPDGEFSVRLFVPDGTSLTGADIQIRTNNSPVTIMWNGLVSWQGGTIGTASNKFKLPSNGIWYGNGVGQDGDDAVASGSSNIAGWGDRDVYYSSAPEQRTYMWTTTDVNNKTVYILTFIMGATDTSGAVDATKAANTKVFLRIEQVQAD
jgi:hypothetical protein